MLAVDLGEDVDVVVDDLVEEGGLFAHFGQQLLFIIVVLQKARVHLRRRLNYRRVTMSLIITDPGRRIKEQGVLLGAPRLLLRRLKLLQMVESGLDGRGNPVYVQRFTKLVAGHALATAAACTFLTVPLRGTTTTSTTTTTARTSTTATNE